MRSAPADHAAVANRPPARDNRRRTATPLLEETATMPAATRRRFLQSAALAAAGLSASAASAADTSDRRREYRLGLVTYMVGAQWDVPTLVAVCKKVGVSPVELRTGHKHGVEPSLSKEQRREVRKRFEDAGVQVWG